MSALDDARESVHNADRYQWTGADLRAELRSMRDAMRALIQHVGHLEDRLERIREANDLFDGS